MLESPPPAAPASSRQPSRFGRLAQPSPRNGSAGHVAVLDEVTGLRNQRVLWKELAQRAAMCSPSSPLALVVLDFDRFGEVNERYDCSVGDAVLRACAEVAREEIPSPHLAFRYRDDELVLLVPGDEEDGREVAERVRERIAAQNTNLPAVTVSGGVAVLHGPVEPMVALGRVGPALQAAKRAGGNRVFLATESLRNGRNGHNGNDNGKGWGDATACRAALAMAVASLEARDRATAAHSDDVVTLSESIGTRLGLSDDQLDRLAAAAQLHDVGKLAIPTEILSKPGPLEDEEWDVIREHTVIGERMLRAVPEMGAVAGIVRHSHESWDGSGYPDGLAGEEIPLASRIILCADAFHAIRSDRPYRPGRSADEALKEVRACAGQQFDPRVVEALVALARDVRRASGAGTSLPRPRRLAALLSALAICGGSSAYAASKDVREVMRDVVKVMVPGTVVEPAEAGAPDFSLRPIDEVPDIVPVATLTPEMQFPALRDAPAYDGLAARPESDASSTLPAMDELTGEPVDLADPRREPIPPLLDGASPDDVATAPQATWPAPSAPEEPASGVTAPIELVTEPDSAAMPELVPVENVPHSGGDGHAVPASSEGPTRKPAKTEDAEDEHGNPHGEPPAASNPDDEIDEPPPTIDVPQEELEELSDLVEDSPPPLVDDPQEELPVPPEENDAPPAEVTTVVEDVVVPLETGPSAVDLPATRPPEDTPAPVTTETPTTE